MSIATRNVRQRVSFFGDRWPAAMWHYSAPRAVQKACSAGNASAGWRAWQRHLRGRKRPVDPAQLIAGKDHALTWGLPAAEIAALFLPHFAARDRRRASEVLQRWLDDTAGNPWKLTDALSALAWCRSLPRLAAVLPAEAWWELLAHLLRAAAEADTAEAGGQRSDDDPLIHQLLAGELALTLAYLFPELSVCRELMPQARRASSAGLANLLDDRGLPHARHLDRLRLLLACWTRCRILGRRLKHGCWHRDADKPYRRFVRMPCGWRCGTVRTFFLLRQPAKAAPNCWRLPVRWAVVRRIVCWPRSCCPAERRKAAVRTCRRRQFTRSGRRRPCCVPIGRPRCRG